ncbi:MAG: hypothetical protein LBE31_05160 [Deltaproteobacteria bacterium]|jgi:hypothetical protein|nr:hypothetical protein [Deltaproteobacteria bacterium]
MRWITSFLKENFGAISLELVLYTGIMTGIIMMGDQMTQQMRFRNNVDLAAASLADIMINQILPPDEADEAGRPETRVQILKRETEDPQLALGLFSDMLGLEPEELAKIKLAIRVTYLNTANVVREVDGVKEYYQDYWENGTSSEYACPKEKMPDLQDHARTLISVLPDLNTDVVMVETCTDGKGNTLKNIVFPLTYHSHYRLSSES